ncbi:MAG TPA: peptidoglycan editing factor PgeF [Cyclobacteriaceae bacterium]|nr:peptidoglycan editing factor PgeF [Cyclobacteriaceae bacterium]
MKKVLINGLYLWQFEKLGAHTPVKHFVTDRNTRPNENDFTLSFSSSPDEEKILNNRKQLATSLGVNPNYLFMPRQVHKTRIVDVHRNTDKNELVDTDALISSEKGICVAVMSADCVPVLLFDTRNYAVAAVHSGWRGAVAKILEKTLNKMNLLFGTKGQDLIACIGPSVSQDSYEVGDEVVQEVRQSFGHENDLMIFQSNNKARLDLWKANEVQLREFGVPSTQIEISDLCTVKNNEHFFSARKGDAGRFAAGIMLV